MKDRSEVSSVFLYLTMSIYFVRQLFLSYFGRGEHLQNLIHVGEYSGVSRLVRDKCLSRSNFSQCWVIPQIPDERRHGEERVYFGSQCEEAASHGRDSVKEREMAGHIPSAPRSCER